MDVARFESDGTPDPTFGGGDGIVITDLNPAEPDAPSDVVIQPDGKIVVVGSKGLSDGWRFAVARYEADGDESHSGVARFLANGDLDAAFSDDGKLITRFGVVDQASDVAIHPDGGIVIVGRALSTGGTGLDFGVARYRSAGRLDQNFSGDGLVRTDFKGEGDFAHSVAIEENGRILVGGYALANQRSNFAIARYSATGRLNLSFGNQGRVRTNFGAGVDHYAYDVAIDSVGLVAVGWGTPILGYDAAVARYLLS